jgi:hypothetical protein
MGWIITKMLKQTNSYEIKVSHIRDTDPIPDGHLLLKAVLIYLSPGSVIAKTRPSSDHQP